MYIIVLQLTYRYHQLDRVVMHIVNLSEMALRILFKTNSENNADTYRRKSIRENTAIDRQRRTPGRGKAGEILFL